MNDIKELQKLISTSGKTMDEVKEFLSTKLDDKDKGNENGKK